MDRSCKLCRYWKSLTEFKGMCQSPKEAAYRGSKHGKAWVQTESSDRCPDFNHKYATHPHD